MINDRVGLLFPERNGHRVEYVRGPVIWANVTWTKGARALMQGEVTSYDTLMVRLRWRRDINKWCRLLISGRCYAIQTLNANRRGNTIQITATEVSDFEIKEKHEPDIPN